jgi:hypothetical protein
MGAAAATEGHNHPRVVAWLWEADRASYGMHHEPGTRRILEELILTPDVTEGEPLLSKSWFWKSVDIADTRGLFRETVMGLFPVDRTRFLAVPEGSGVDDVSMNV